MVRIPARPSHPVHAPETASHYIADFYCASRLLVIEVDGDSHYTDRGEAYDASRTTALEAQGIRVFRVTNLEVLQQFEGVCQRIVQALEKT